MAFVNEFTRSFMALSTTMILLIREVTSWQLSSAAPKVPALADWKKFASAR